MDSDVGAVNETNGRKLRGRLPAGKWWDHQLTDLESSCIQWPAPAPVVYLHGYDWSRRAAARRRGCLDEGRSGRGARHRDAGEVTLSAKK